MRFLITVLAFALIAVLAFRLGRRPERIIAQTLVASFAATVVNTRFIHGPHSYSGVDPVVLAIDGLTWLVLCRVAIEANRVWPLTVTALQTIVLIAHFSVIARVGWRQVYWAMMAYPQYVQIAIVLWGIVQHHLRERRIGRYRDWRIPPYDRASR